MSDDFHQSQPTSPPKGLGVYSRNGAVWNAYRRMGELQEITRYRRLMTDPALSARRSLYIVAGLLIAASVILNLAPLVVAGLLVLALAAVPEIWYVFGMRGLTFSRAPDVSRAEFLSVVEAPIIVENRSALPLPFVEVVDTFPDDLPTLAMSLDISPLPERAQLEQNVGLWAFQRVRRRFYIRAAQRGAFTFGPTVVKVTDPFGVLTREETLSSERTLIVHPLVAPLERFGLTPKALFGDRTSRVRLLEDPLRMSGVRQYMSGDDPRRVHWKATARTGTLQSKILDPSTQRTLMIALDVRTYRTAQMGYDPELSELAISAAASLATWAFDEGYSVGVLSNGSLKTVLGDDATSIATHTQLSGEIYTGMEPRLRLAPSARRERLTQILDGLARLLPYNSSSLAGMLTSERYSLPHGASLVFIGLESLVDVPTLIALREIRSRGRDVTLLLTTRDGEAGHSDSDAIRNLRGGMFAMRYLGGRARWQEILKEALGDMPYRRASAPISADLLQDERALIAERRRLRNLTADLARFIPSVGQFGGAQPLEDADGTHAAALS